MKSTKFKMNSLAIRTSLYAKWKIFGEYLTFTDKDTTLRFAVSYVHLKCVKQHASDRRTSHFKLQAYQLV